MDGSARDAVDAWNATFPVGTPVRYWPGNITGSGQVGATSSPAWVLGGHTAVVSIGKVPGGIALTHVDPCEESEN